MYLYTLYIIIMPPQSLTFSDLQLFHCCGIVYLFSLVFAILFSIMLHYRQHRSRLDCICRGRVQVEIVTGYFRTARTVQNCGRTTSTYCGTIFNRIAG